jgi:hypothetical protein
LLLAEHTLDRFARPQMSVLAGPEDQNTTRTQQQYSIRLFCGDLDINLIPRRPLMPSDGRQHLLIRFFHSSFTIG